MTREREYGFEGRRDTRPRGYSGEEQYESGGQLGPRSQDDWRRFGGNDEPFERQRFGDDPERNRGRQRFGREAGPHVGKGPKNWRRSDERIVEQVSEALERDPYLDASDIEVSCAEGEVVLRGCVEDRSAKRAAEECVENLPGVKDVRNELRVQPRDEGRRGERESELREPGGSKARGRAERSDAPRASS
jgi:hypothetical protein